MFIPKWVLMDLLRFKREAESRLESLEATRSRNSYTKIDLLNEEYTRLSEEEKKEFIEKLFQGASSFHKNEALENYIKDFIKQN